jgi:hypothetical protein
VRGYGLLNPTSFFYPIKYVDFIRDILKNFNNVDVKVHPKAEKIDYYVCKKRIRIGDLKTLINEYDAIILDTVHSTAFAILSASNLPIIYLQSTGKSMNENGWQKMLARVHHFKLDVDLLDIPQEFFDGFYLSYDIDHSFTRSFSMESRFKNNGNRLSKLFKTL